MKNHKLILFFIFLFSITISNAQKSKIEIITINCMPAETFFENNQSLREGETLAIGVNYTNILSQAASPIIQLRLLNGYEIFQNVTSTVLNVATNPTQQTVTIIFKVPKIDISTPVDKVRIQAYAYGNKDAEGTQQEMMFSYSGPYLLD